MIMKVNKYWKELKRTEKTQYWRLALRLRLTLQETKQQVNGSKSLVPSLATGHANLPLPDVKKRQVTEDLVVS